MEKDLKQIIIDGVDVNVCEHNCDKNLGEYCRCNLYPPPLNCKYHPNCLFKQLARKKQECEELKSENFTFEELIKTQEEQLDDDNVIIERFLTASGKSKDITEPDEFEEVFQDIEQTYSEHEELKKECKDLKQALDEIKRYRICEINDEDGEEGDVILGIIDETEEQNNG